MTEAYEQGYQDGLKQGSALRVSAVWQKAFDLGYEYGSQEFNDFLTGYAKAYSIDLNLEQLKEVRD